jgi:anti-sigma factor RsiW
MAGQTKSKNIIRSADTCRDATDLILDYLSGELSPELNSDFEKHLQACPDCAAFLNTYKKTLELTKSFLLKQ